MSFSFPTCLYSLLAQKPSFHNMLYIYVFCSPVWVFSRRAGWHRYMNTSGILYYKSWKWGGAFIVILVAAVFQMVVMVVLLSWSTSHHTHTHKYIYTRRAHNRLNERKAERAIEAMTSTRALCNSVQEKPVLLAAPQRQRTFHTCSATPRVDSAQDAHTQNTHPPPFSQPVIHHTWLLFRLLDDTVMRIGFFFSLVLCLSKLLFLFALLSFIRPSLSFYLSTSCFMSFFNSYKYLIRELLLHGF